MVVLGTATSTGNRALLPSLLDRARAAALSPVGSSFAASILIFLLATVTGALLARILGPDGRGTLAAVLLLPGIVTMLGSLGLSQATTVWAADSTVAIGTLAGTLLMLAIVQTAILIPLGSFAIAILMDGYPAPTRRLMLLFLATYIPMSLLTTYCRGILQGRSLFRQFNILRIIVFAVPAAIFPILALTGHLTVRNATLVYIASSLGSVLLTAYWTAPCIDTPFRVSLALSGDLLRFGMRGYLGNLAGMLNERLDQAVLAVFLNPAQLGLYIIAVTTSSPVIVTGASVGIPATTAAAKSASRPRSIAVSTRYMAFTVMMSAILMIPILIMTPWLIGLTFGHDFVDSVPAARILLVAALLLSFNSVLSSILTGLRQPLVASVGQMISLVVSAVGLVVLLPPFGLVGAAITSLLAYLIANCYFIIKLASILEISTLGLLRSVLVQALFLARYPVLQMQTHRQLGRQQVD